MVCAKNSKYFLKIHTDKRGAARAAEKKKCIFLFQKMQKSETKTGRVFIKMTRTEARAAIKNRADLVTEQLTKSKGTNQFVCPICGSGSGRKHTGALHYYPEAGRFVCFACSDDKQGFGGKGQDVLGALRLLWSCTEKEVFERAGFIIDREQRSTQEHAQRTQEAGETMSKDNTPQKAEAAKTTAQELTEAADFTEYYKECALRLQHSKDAISYLQARGISTETAAAYWIGYDPEADPAQSGFKSPRLITPTSKGHYVARSIDPATPAQYQKMNNKGGTPAIFNIKAVYNPDNRVIFVTEGFFDALSIIEAGETAIALNSTSNAGRLIDQLQEKRTAATFILCLDNDGAGQKATKTVKDGLQRLNISFVTADICGKYKDPNEHLQASREGFTKAIEEAKRRTIRPDNITDYIDNIMSGEILQFKEAKDRKTGFANLDEQSRGLYAGLYVVAAISSLGKTTFCHQIADQLAAAGEDVLFFSLEQSRLELVSKSLARRTAQEEITTAVNSLSIRRGYLPHQVLKAAADYKAAIGDRMSIIEGNFACNISFIGDYIRQYVQNTGKKPVVFVDYLQILQPEQDKNGRTQSTKETVDTTVTELKRISREQGLTVFVISSVNRANYLTPIDFESLKESGGIEYTGDVIWGLQLQCMNDAIFDEKNKIKEKRQRVKEAKAATPRQIELVCLKNRYGVSSYSAYFNYYPEFDLFTEGKQAEPEGRPAPTIKKRLPKRHKNYEEIEIDEDVTEIRGLL